jgi:putative Mn2+ efflux pump MntP
MTVNWFNLIFSSILLGVGLAMDAFSVSLANGLNEPKMKLKKVFLISGIFAFFQGLMPLIGWIAISGFLELFNKFKPFIPWISFILLCFIGGKMLFDSIKSDTDDDKKSKTLTFGALLLQAVATSIDALTAGINFAKDYSLQQWAYVILATGIIVLLTFVICFFGVKLGQKVGTKFSNKAGILGGGVLIFLGLKIFVTDILFR